MIYQRIARSAIGLILIFTFGTVLPFGEETSSSGGLLACEADDGGLILPEGFCAVIVVDNIGHPRHIDVAANGDIYVRNRGSRDRDSRVPGEGVVALRDTNGDGRAEIVERFADHYGTGLELRDDYLYVSTSMEVFRYRMTGGDLLPSGPRELLVSGFPEQRGHSDKAFAFDENGHLYVNVGAPSNSCQAQARTAGSVGRQPCPQRERQASVWQFDADRLDQTQLDNGHQFVQGTRNILGLAWDPTTRALFAMQHGRDSLATLFGIYFSDEESAELPSEELLELREGADFGWPYCYYDHLRGARILAPEYGGDGQTVGDCGQYDRPLVAFPAHWAPHDLLFYTGDQFPARYVEGAFVVFHGSWNRAPLEQGGYQVVFAPRRNGEFTGDWETFVDGFAVESPLISPRDAVHRPAGVAQGPDGSIYITDDTGGRVWRIVYTGS